MTSPGRWAVGLDGDDYDLGELGAHLGGTITIRRADPDGWEVSTDHFESLGEAGAIRQSALELVAMLNGLAGVRIYGAGPITVGNVRRYGADGSKDVWAFPEPILLRVRTFAPTILINGVAPTPVPWNPGLELADRSEEVRSVLAFLGVHPPTWHSLAAALEVIMQDARTDRRDGVQAWGGMSDRRLRRFTSTANSWPVLGIHARHGPVGWAPPRNPLPLADAVVLVRGIAARWLDELVRRGA